MTARTEEEVIQAITSISEEEFAKLTPEQQDAVRHIRSMSPDQLDSIKGRVKQLKRIAMPTWNKLQDSVAYRESFLADPKTELDKAGFGGVFPLTDHNAGTLRLVAQHYAATDGLSRCGKCVWLVVCITLLVLYLAIIVTALLVPEFAMALALMELTDFLQGLAFATLVVGMQAYVASQEICRRRGDCA